MHMKERGKIKQSIFFIYIKSRKYNNVSAFGTNQNSFNFLCIIR